MSSWKSIVAVGLLLATPLAQASTQAQIKTCQQIKNNAERLACYDQLAASIFPKKTKLADNLLEQSAPVSQRKVMSAKAPVVQETTVPKTASASVTSTPEKAKQAEERLGEKYLSKSDKQEPESFVFTIAALRKDKRKKWQLDFDNGQRWKQIDSEVLFLKVGDKVEMKEGFFGVVYLKKLNANKKIKVKRQK